MSLGRALESFAFLFAKNPELPKEMKNDPLLKNLNVKGPFGKSHDELRRAYYSIRDGETVNNPRLEEHFKYMCHDSPELFLGNEDTSQELRIICGVVGHHITTSKAQNQQE